MICAPGQEGRVSMNSFDLSISSLISRLAHRSLRFDLFVILVSNTRLLKGGVILGLIWWAWFQDEDRRRTREALLAAIIASFPALAVARVLSWVFFRPRPFNDTRFVSFRVPYGVEAAYWEGNSSFPSDHTVLFFALVTGIFFASRRAGWFALVYVSLVICLPRVYIGEHYATDILAGAALGTSMAWLANRPLIRKPLTGWALRWLDARPGQFYLFSFLVTYQMAELFAPLINIFVAVTSIAHGKPPPP